MTPRRKRMLFIAAIIAGMGISMALILTAFEKNLMYFYSPSEIASGNTPPFKAFRVGGLVVAGSVQRDPESLEVEFRLTDTAKEITVRYDGILPDLFREGQGIVANGKLTRGGVFQAAQVLAKHDENYMPPEVADALDKATMAKAAATLD